MFHEVFLLGHLGRDAELRYTAEGTPVANFSMATTEKWTDRDGQLQERTVWWRVSVWGKTAENLSQYLVKGKPVFIKGQVRPDENGNPRTYQRNDGTTGASFEVTARMVKLLGSGQAQTPPEAEAEADSEVPF